MVSISCSGGGEEGVVRVKVDPDSEGGGVGADGGVGGAGGGGGEYHTGDASSACRGHSEVLSGYN